VERQPQIEHRLNTDAESSSSVQIGVSSVASLGIELNSSWLNRAGYAQSHSHLVWTPTRALANNLPMPHSDFDVAALARYLHVTPAQVTKLAERGTVPGRRIGGQWRFARAEIHHWLEGRIGAADEADLAHVQHFLDREAAAREPATVDIGELLVPAAIAVPLAARTRNSVITAMVELAAGTGYLWDASEMAAAVRAREELHPTALDNGVALLHPRRPLASILAQPLLALGITHQGIAFGSETGQLTDVFFLICSTDDSQHLRTLARLSRLLSQAGFLPELRAAASPAEVLQVVQNYEAQTSSE
jgi:PTS system nitrogen regulatory IIA component